MSLSGLRGLDLQKAGCQRAQLAGVPINSPTAEEEMAFAQRAAVKRVLAEIKEAPDMAACGPAIKTEQRWFKIDGTKVTAAKGRTGSAQGNQLACHRQNRHRVIILLRDGPADMILRDRKPWLRG